MLALLLSIAYYILLFDPATANRAGQCNKLDVHILGFRRRLLGWVKKRRYITDQQREALGAGFRNDILALADLQIVTGLCALVAAFINIKSTPALYWQMLVYIAWFSNVTHQCALIFLRQHFQNNLSARNWRMFLMTCLAALLFVAVIPTLWFDWDRWRQRTLLTHPELHGLEERPYKALPAASAWCYYDRGRRHAILPGYKWKEPWSSTYISLIFVLVSHIIRTVKLYDQSSRFFRETVTGNIGSLYRRAFSAYLRYLDKVTMHKLGPEFWFYLVESPLIATYLSLRMLLLIFTSTISDLFIVIYGCMIGLRKLINDKQTEAELVESTEGLGDLSGFGQLLPSVVLLISPVIAMIQAFGHTEGGNSKDESQFHAMVNTPVPENEIAPRLTPIQLPSLTAPERFKRLNSILHQDFTQEPWFVPASTVTCIGELYILISSFASVVWEFPLGGLIGFVISVAVPIGSSIPITLMVVLTGVISGKPGKAQHWVCSAIFSLYYVGVLAYHYHYAIRSGEPMGFQIDFTLCGVPCVMPVLYFLVCFIRCLTPKRWGLRPKLRKDSVDDITTATSDSIPSTAAEGETNGPPGQNEAHRNNVCEPATGESLLPRYYQIPRKQVPNHPILPSFTGTSTPNR